MGELIEHPDTEDGNLEVIKTGDANSLVSVKVYQDIYHQLTGRTEQVRKRYSDNLLVEFAEIEQLHFKIQQLCDVHKIVACNEVISVFHDKERKEQFTSFKRFRTYNANAASPTVNLVLKYNFSIILAGLDKPQEYVVLIRLTSRVAMLQQIQQEVPPFVRGHFIEFFNLNTAEVTIDYADYIIARGFLEAFEEWVRGCKKSASAPWLNALRRWSHFVPGTAKLITGILISWFALQSIPVFFSPTTTPVIWARFFVVYTSGALILVPIMGAIGRQLEMAIDTYPVLSYLKLNKGDGNLIDEFDNRRRSVIFRLIFSSLFSVVLGIIATKLEKLV